MSSIAFVAQTLGVLVWDVSLTLINLVTPNRKVEHVTPKGHPGADGVWPEFIAPKEGDSRCCCPALNAMANHGILPRDGRNISFKEMNRTIRATYNFAPTFCFLVPNYSANMLKKDYNKDTFDLEELNLHGTDPLRLHPLFCPGIEHDASLTREDLQFQPNQNIPHLPYIRELLDSATGKDKDGNLLLTPADLSRISSKRRAEARAANNNSELSGTHKKFGSSNSSTLLTIFGGRIKDLESILIDERLPDKWESRILGRKGLTILTFNLTVSKVENAIDDSKVATSADAATSPTSIQKTDT